MRKLAVWRADVWQLNTATTQPRRRNPKQKVQHFVSVISPRALGYKLHLRALQCCRPGCGGAGSAVGQGLGLGIRNTGSMSPFELGYFVDAPWGRVPEERKGELVLAHPPTPRGLLGGSSGQKPSKLAELARRRKEKAQANAAGKEEKHSVSLLSRLSQKQPLSAKPAPKAPPPVQPPRRPPQTTPATARDPEPEETSGPKRDDLDQPKGEDVPMHCVAPPPALAPTPSLVVASPSIFAKTIFGERITLRHEIGVADGLPFFVSGNSAPAKTNAFSGPSPDDIVVAAQSGSKGGQPKLDYS